MNIENKEKTTWITLYNLALEVEIPIYNSINTTNCFTFLQQVEINDVLPFSKGEIRFSSDIWDFSEYSSLNINKSSLIFYFEPFPICYKKMEKYFIFISIINNKIKIQTLYSKHRCMRVFFSYLESVGIKNVLDVTIEDLTFFITNRVKKDLSPSTTQNYIDALKDFFVFYNTNITELSDEDIIPYLSNRNSGTMKAYKEINKAKPIPDWYYNKLLVGLIHYMNDENCPYYIKGPACMYILLSQQGNRIGELLSLDVNSRKITESFNGDKLSYLYYDSWKGCKGNNTRSQNFTYINELSNKAFDVLLNIPEYKERREKWDISYLYCGGRHTQKDQFPLASKNFSDYSLVLWEHLDNDGFLETINININHFPFLETRNIEDYVHKKLSRKGEEMKFVARPSTQQFRFHVITELYNKGVCIEYIKRFMSHLTLDMTRYHIHKGNKVQEDLEAAKRVLKGIVTGDEKIIGGDKGLSSNIQKFIEANNFNVEKDLDAIVSKLAEDIPISVKTGGVCIKSSRYRSCSIDNRTNEMYCAYGVCANICHFFYHCDIAWRKCKELKEVIDINQKRGFLKQVYKDTNSLRSIISQQLLPEMDELQVQVEDKGINTIYERYPDLIDIIENFDEIKKEVTSWLQKTQQIQ